MKTDPDTLDPVTNDDSLADVPKDTLDPVPCDAKPKRTRKPSMKKCRVKADAER